MSFGLFAQSKIAKLNSTQANAGMMPIHIVARVLVLLAEYCFNNKHYSIKAVVSTDITV